MIGDYVAFWHIEIMPKRRFLVYRISEGGDLPAFVASPQHSEIIGPFGK